MIFLLVFVCLTFMGAKVQQKDAHGLHNATVATSTQPYWHTGRTGNPYQRARQ